MITKAQVQGLGVFPQWGFTIEHDGAIAVCLFHQGELVGRFSQTGATEKSLQMECALHLVNCHKWDGALWAREGVKHDSL